ncbi:MAG: glycosyltransferase family 1 protein [Actinobacteria bacterium]|nr:glycosyltransferase family 1 protein [Actinomycetota bacterium]MDA2952367.1 glycosyltransferase family 1 protein [Actinomycetota bacterium]MDA2999682.1 glycosyltransferase family 1 protein [Actinomycetota bacterium]
MISQRPQIAVNMLWCVPGNVGGSEEYFVRQLLGLAEIGAPFDVAVYAPRGFTTAHPEVADVAKVVEAPSSCRNRELRVWLENTWLASRTSRAHLVHHGGGTMPSRGNRSTLLTVHDVQYLTFPEYFSRLKLAYLRNRVPSAIRRATVIAAPSEYVRSSIEHNFGTDRARTTVVRHGLEQEIGQGRTSESELRQRFNLGQSRILVMPAITHPHKNHQFILNLLANQWRAEDVKVVMVGGKGLADNAVQRQIVDLGLSERVVRSGRVNAPDRDGLLAMAEALVFPSLYEGFGAPVIEAMALGAPVITSNCASLPEVVGDAGLVLGLSGSEWSGALDQVRQQRHELVQRGLARAAQFSAAKSAEDLVLAYEKVLAAGRR